MTGDLVFVLAALVLALSGGLGASAMRLPTAGTWVLGSLVLAAAGVVLVAEVLSLVDALGRTELLAAEGLLFVVSAAVWWRAGRPRPPRPPGPRSALGGVRGNAAVVPVIVAAGATLAVQFAVGITTAPSNWDSMTYHLSRAAYWLQERSMLDHAGGSIRQLDSPPNAEVLMAWSLAMARGDGWVALVQWTALAGTAVAIAVTARTLGAARAPSLFAAAVFVILPGPVLESVTTQNDLVACFTATSAVALGVTGLARGQRGLLVLAGVALGIGIGVKGTVLFGLPAVGLILLAAAVKGRAWRGLGGLIAAAVVATAALGAFGYIEAFVREGDPFGGVREQTERITPVPGNAVRVATSLLDSPGLPLPWADRAIAEIAGPVRTRLEDYRDYKLEVDSALNEDVVAAGLIGWVVLFPLALIMLFAPRTELRWRAVALALPLYVLTVGVLVDWTPFTGRILLMGIALGAPLLAWIAVRPWVAGAVSVIAILGLAPALLTNPFKTIVPEPGQPTIWGLDRIAQQTLPRPEVEPVLRALNRRIAPGAPLVWVGGEDTWDYPFFGPHLEHHVTRLRGGDLARLTPAAQRARIEAAARRSDAHLVVIGDAPREAPRPPAGMTATSPTRGWYLVDVP